MRRKQHAITLLELVIAFTIMAIMVFALCVPVLLKARDKSRRAGCAENERKIGRALHRHHDTFGELPAGSPLVAGPEFSFDTRLALIERGFDGRQVEWNWVTATLQFMPERRVLRRFNRVFMADDSQAFPAAGPEDDPDSNAYQIARTRVRGLICPDDDAARNPIFDNRWWTSGCPPVAQGLWYTGSMGPTIPDLCVFGPIAQRGEFARVCMGCSVGTSDALGCAPCYFGNGTGKSPSCVQQGLFVGMFGRTDATVKFQQVTDGLSYTWMAGETLPAQWVNNCAWGANFPLSTTHIPLNTMETDFDAEGNIDRQFWRSSGFKSAHRKGANMLLGDGSVRFVSESIDYFVWNEYGTTAGGEMAEDLPRRRPRRRHRR